MTDDFYCDEVLSGKTIVSVVYETEDVLAFHHTRPNWPVHIVVIPKMHLPSIINLGEHPIDVVHKVLDVVRIIAKDINEKYGAARVLTNIGEYQDSKHLHFHVNYGEPLRQ